MSSRAPSSKGGIVEDAPARQAVKVRFSAGPVTYDRHVIPIDRSRDAPRALLERVAFRAREQREMAALLAAPVHRESRERSEGRLLAGEVTGVSHVHEPQDLSLKG